MRTTRQPPVMRRVLLLAVAVGLISLSLAAMGSVGAQVPTLLDAAAHPKFQNPVPSPAVLDATEGGTFRIKMKQKTQWLGLVDSNGDPLLTNVWGYRVGRRTYYPGPTIEAYEGVPVDIKWVNRLPNNHLLPVDDSLHLADPSAGIPTVTHLHGGHTESASDGLPEAWFTRDWAETGPQFVKETYHYDNDQQAATLWYHDHALGITRLNVYAGLAGFYLLHDDNEQALIDGGVLPDGDYDQELVIQDRMFTGNGQLYFPADPIESGAPDPSVIPEFFGDYILVNGMAWPYMTVEPALYRLRLLNGSDSRFYDFEFDNGMDFLHIATDNGFLNEPRVIDGLLLAPGERAEIVVDFRNRQGNDIVLENVGPDEPYKGGAQTPADPNTTGRIMQFRVLGGANVANATIHGTSNLNSIDTLTAGDADNTRKLVLFETEDEHGRLRPMLGTMEDGTLFWDDQITEDPALGSVEIWEIYNATEDSHPIHLHLVAFQVLNRQRFNCNGNQNLGPCLQDLGWNYPTMGVGLKLDETQIQLQGSPVSLEDDAGLKDTVQVPPGSVVRVIATFDRPGRYVWHCHILSHEDHEMMRPFEVGEGQVVEGVTEARVSASSDDAEQNGGVNLRSSDLEMVEENNPQTVGIRWDGLNIPVGATITKAWVQFTVDETTGRTTVLDIRGHDTGDAPTFSTTNDVVGRPLTTNAASWTVPRWNTMGASGADQRTVDISNVIQEVVGNGGWAPGNAIALIIGGNGKRVAESYDGDPDKAPLLHVEWNTTGAPPDPCGLDPTAPGCPQDPCVLDPTSPGCPQDPCILDPSSCQPEPDGELNLRIAAGSDDVEENGNNGNLMFGSSDLEMIEENTIQTVGLWWDGLSIPNGATITAAWVQFTVDEPTGRTTNLSITADVSGDAAPFSGVNGVSSRIAGPSVPWSPPRWENAGDSLSAQRTADLSALIQSVVNRGDWAPGNAIALIIDGVGKRVAVSYNGDPDRAPLLHVEWTTP